MLFKTISVKSPSGAQNCADSAFLNDIEVRVVLRGAESSEIIITFFALENDLEALVRGYLSVFNLKADLVRENNIFYADLPLSKEAILAHLSQKDFIQSCEQISLNDKKIMRDSVIIPFNGSRAKITNEFLEANRAFFAESIVYHSERSAKTIVYHSERSEESQKIIDSAKCVDSADLDSAFCARIFTNPAESSFAQSFDTNPKNTIYKTIGKALQKSDNLLDSAIFLNFCIDIECLKILLLQKCTFIICKKLPPFSVVKFAQKFGTTLVCFHKNRFFAVTHQMRLG